MCLVHLPLWFGLAPLQLFLLRLLFLYFLPLQLFFFPSLLVFVIHFYLILKSLLVVLK